MLGVGIFRNAVIIRGRVLYEEIRYLVRRVKNREGANSDILFLGWTVRADIFGQMFLGSQ